MSETDTPSVGDGSTETQVLSKGVDWLVTAILVLGGLLLGLLGLLFNSVADRAEIARLVAEGTIESTVLSDAELVDATYAVVWWGGLGLAVMGALLVVGGIGFFAYRRRTRRRRAELGITGPDTTTNAIVGAVVTVLTSFIPFSPILGGAIAGYLEGGSRMNGARAGGLSGAVASLPIVLLFVFLIGGLVIASAEVSFVVGAGVVALILAISMLVAVTYMVLLSAVGGYIGVYLSDERAQTGDDHSPSA
jgi:hypothetical protein